MDKISPGSLIMMTWTGEPVYMVVTEVEVTPTGGLLASRWTPAWDHHIHFLNPYTGRPDYTWWKRTRDESGGLVEEITTINVWTLICELEERSHG